jgi:hypothetical protein
MQLLFPASISRVCTSLYYNLSNIKTNVLFYFCKIYVIFFCSRVRVLGIWWEMQNHSSFRIVRFQVLTCVAVWSTIFWDVILMSGRSLQTFRCKFTLFISQWSGISQSVQLLRFKLDYKWIVVRFPTTATESSLPHSVKAGSDMLGYGWDQTQNFLASTQAAKTVTLQNLLN